MKAKLLFFVITFNFMSTTVFSQLWLPMGKGIYNENTTEERKQTKPESKRKQIDKHHQNVRVNTLVVYKDELYAAGEFSFAGKEKALNIAKWDGQKWTNVGGGINGVVEKLCVYKNELYVAGFFSMAGKTKANNIAKWDGKSWTAVGEGLNSTTHTLIVYKEELYAAGEFSETGNQKVNHLAKWDGAKWSSLSTGIDNDIFALTIHNDELYAAGTFINAGDEKEKSIFKWNGAAWSEIDAHMNGAITSMLSFQGNLVVGGYFRSVNKVPIPILAVNREGSWYSLGNELAKESEKFGKSLKTKNSQKPQKTLVTTLFENKGVLYAAGKLNAAGGKGIIKWDGKNWSNMEQGVVGTVRAMVIYQGNLVIAGTFSSANGRPINNIAIFKSLGLKEDEK